MRSSRSSRTRELGAAGCFLFLGIVCYATLAAGKDSPSPKPEAKTETSAPLTGIPLPIGQEAKGLVLPDFDLQGKMRARFEAGTAKRIDADHLSFSTLKMTTYDEQNKPDLVIEMPASSLDLNTRVISSKERTKVVRADFEIVGDTMQFDTVSRQGTLVGNVKMVIINGTAVTGQKPK